MLFKNKQDRLEELYQSGEKQFEKENYEAAVQCYQKAAERGHSDSQYSLGFCYDYGKGVRQDARLAVYWYQAAAKQNNAQALFHLGVIFENGRGVPINTEAALNYYAESARLGCQDAQLQLGNCYVNGVSGEPDHTMAIAFWTLAAQQGSHEAKHNIDWLQYVDNNELELGLNLISGTSDQPKQVQRGLSLLQKGVDLGDSEASWRLGQYKIEGIPPVLPSDYPGGIELVLDAAKEGEASAFLYLHHLFRGDDAIITPLKGNADLMGAYAIQVATAIEDRDDLDEGHHSWVFAYAAWAFCYGYGTRKDLQKANYWISKLPEWFKRNTFVTGIVADLAN